MPPDRLDVDARFLLANERTLLAWVRTALTLLAAGVAVEQLAADVAGRTPLALLLLGSGLIAALAGGARYRAADTALREGRLPLTGRAPYVLVAMVAVASTLAVLVVAAGLD